MANRQAPEGVVVELPPEQLTHYLRMINRVPPDQALPVALCAAQHMKRLGLKRDFGLVKIESFDGALNSDMGTLMTWMAKVMPNHKRAKKQLAVLDASAAYRGGLKE
jgi:hypothetical protein